MVHTDIAHNLKKLVLSPPFSIQLCILSFFFLIFVSIFLSFIAGDGTRLPPLTLLWPFWLWQENPNHGCSPPNVRNWCRKGFLFLFLLHLSLEKALKNVFFWSNLVLWFILFSSGCPHSKLESGFVNLAGEGGK